MPNYLVDPKLKRNTDLSATHITNDSILSKSQIEEFIGDVVIPETIELGDVMKVTGSHNSTMFWVGNTIFVVGDSNSTDRVFGFSDEHISEPRRASNFDKSTIVDASCGTKHAIVVLDDGTAWCSGRNAEGQLGDPGIGTATTAWTQVIGPWLSGAKILKAYCMNNRTFLLVDESGLPGAPDTYTYRLWVSGQNGQGQCGVGSLVNVTTWQMVLGVWVSGSDIPYDIDELQVVGNHESTQIYTPAPGVMWIAGKNSEGQLGDTTTIRRESFTQVSFTSGIPGYSGVNVSKVFAADRSFGIVGDDGNLYFAGWNGADTWGGTPPDSNPNWTQVVGFSDIKDAASGHWVDYGATYTAVVAITNSGSVVVIGHSHFGELGIEPAGYVTSPVTIPSDRVQGSTFMAVWMVGLTTFLLDSTGNLWTCGYNLHGQAGLGVDHEVDDDQISTPHTVTEINNARLYLALQNKEQGYSHPVIPNVIQQTVVSGGSDAIKVQSYEYREATNTPPIAAVANDWVKVPLNTAINEQIPAASLVTGGMLLPAGNYQLSNAWCSFNIHYAAVGIVGVRVRNVDLNSDIAFLTANRGNGFTEDAENFRLEIPLVHNFTLASPTRVELQAFKNDTRTLGGVANVAGYPEIYGGMEIRETPDLTNPWSYDSGWQTITDVHTFTHNLTAEEFQSLVVQFRDDNNVVMTAAPWQSYREDAFTEWGFYVTHTPQTVVLTKLPNGYLTPYRTPPGWAGTQPTHVRLFLKR